MNDPIPTFQTLEEMNGYFEMLFPFYSYIVKEPVRMNNDIAYNLIISGVVAEMFSTKE